MASDLGEERDLVNQLLGQAQMADAFAKFSVTVTTSKLNFVKENKLYRALQGKRTGDGHQFSGTWEEFCSLLGRSREQVDEDIRNLRALGEEALESMSRMGIGYRELRQWRRLPEDARSALIEAVKQGNKDAVEYLAEELIELGDYYLQVVFHLQKILFNFHSDSSNLIQASPVIIARRPSGISHPLSISESSTSAPPEVLPGSRRGRCSPSNLSDRTASRLPFVGNFLQTWNCFTGL